MDSLPPRAEAGLAGEAQRAPRLDNADEQDQDDGNEKTAWLGRLTHRERRKDSEPAHHEGIGGLRRTATSLQQLPHMVAVGLSIGVEIDERFDAEPLCSESAAGRGQLAGRQLHAGRTSVLQGSIGYCFSGRVL